MHRQKPEKLLGIRPHESGGVVVRFASRVDQTAVVRLADPGIGGDVEDDRPIDPLQRFDMLIPGMRGRRTLVRTPERAHRGVLHLGWHAVTWRVIVNVDDPHWFLLDACVRHTNDQMEFVLMVDTIRHSAKLSTGVHGAGSREQGAGSNGSKRNWAVLCHAGS